MWKLSRYVLPCLVLQAKGKKTTGIYYSRRQFSLECVRSVVGRRTPTTVLLFCVGEYCTCLPTFPLQISPPSLQVLGGAFMLPLVQMMWTWARVNQQPPMHQLAILSTGWAAFFLWAPDGVHHNKLLLIIVVFFCSWAVFPLDLTSHKATLFTFLPS
jgi:hypothetical protein